MPINISLNFIMESESSWSNLITEEPELRTLSGRQNADLCQSAILSSTPREEDPVESMRIRTPLSDELTNREAHVVTRSLPKIRDIQTASGVELNPSWLREVTSVPQVGIADYHSYSLPSGVPVIEHDNFGLTRAIGQPVMTSLVVPTSKVRRSARLSHKEPVSYRFEPLPHKRKASVTYQPPTSEQLAPPGSGHAIIGTRSGVLPVEFPVKRGMKENPLTCLIETRGEVSSLFDVDERERMGQSIDAEIDLIQNMISKLSSNLECLVSGSDVASPVDVKYHPDVTKERRLRNASRVVVDSGGDPRRHKPLVSRDTTFLRITPSTSASVSRLLVD